MSLSIIIPALSLLLSVLGFMITAIVLPVLIYVWKERDKKIAEMDRRLDVLEIELTKHSGELGNIAKIYAEMKAIREEMKNLVSKSDIDLLIRASTVK